MRKLFVAVVAAGAAFGMFGAGTAGAITLPAGDGSVQCGIAGSVKVRRPLATPDKWKIVAVGSIGGCTYNGNPIPFSVTGAARTVAVDNPAAVCAALADGSAAAKTSVVVKLNGTKYLGATIQVDLDVSPSAPGSLVEVSGGGTVSGVALSGGVTVQTDRPLADLCNGATRVLFLGTAHLDWDRP